MDILDSNLKGGVVQITHSCPKLEASCNQYSNQIHNSEKVHGLNVCINHQILFPKAKRQGKGPGIHHISIYCAKHINQVKREGQMTLAYRMLKVIRVPAYTLKYQ